MLHVSGSPIAGAASAVRRLRDDGHRIRFVTNSTTRSRAQLAEQMREMGIALDDEELQTTGSVASKALKGRRVLALTMPGILDDLEGLQLVGMNVDAVLIGGADEGEETGRVFSYLNLNRAFHELEAGAELYRLHKNRWWQTADGARLDTGAFVAGLEYAADIEATVLGKPSHRLLRGCARGARRGSAARVDGRGRPRGRLHRRTEARHADRARAHGEVPARRHRALADAARRDHLVDRAAARLVGAKFR